MALRRTVGAWLKGAIESLDKKRKKSSTAKPPRTQDN